MAAVSSAGDIYFSFLDGNNNEGSFASFLVALEIQLTKVRPDWRDTHVFLLDNCSIHKTHLAREILKNLGYPVIFSAPASFLAIPIEGMFGALKAVDFASIPDPEASILEDLDIRHVTKKQALMIKIANYLFKFKKEKVLSLFKQRLAHLDKFLRACKV